MATNYDPIAEQYKLSKEQPWRMNIESYTLLNLIGDATDKAVVDIACGEGFYSRLLRRRGARSVTGVDLSERMIALAQAQEAKQPLGIEYSVGDGRNLALQRKFDLVVAAYLLNYARNSEELRAMCNGIARVLEPGGRFVTVNCNPTLNFAAAPSYRKYGFATSVASELREGAPIKWTFFLEAGSFEIENYFLDAATHETAFRSAGFREIQWHRPRLSPEGEAAQGRDYWRDFMENPPIIFIECVK